MPFRHTVVHTGGITILADGTVKITNRKSGKTLQLTDVEQGCYIRAICLIAEQLIDNIDFKEFHESLVEGDFSRLKKYHSVNTLVVEGAILSSVTVNVPKDQVETNAPLAVRVNFDEIGILLNEIYAGVNRVYFSATVIVDTGLIESRWEIPVEAVPRESVLLTVGDSKFDCYLTHRGK